MPITRYVRMGLVFWKILAKAKITTARLKRHIIPVMILRGMLTTSCLRALPMVTQINKRNMKLVKRKFSTQVLI